VFRTLCLNGGSGESLASGKEFQPAVWSTVLLMAIVAGADPVRFGLVVFMLSGTRPIPLLLAYFIGGFGINLLVGAVIVFIWRDAGLAVSGSSSSEIEIAVGLLAILVGALVAGGFRPWLRHRVRTPGGAGAAGGRPGLEQLPGLAKLPPRVQAALKSRSIWVGWIAGLGMGVPTPYYLAAIAAVLTAGAAVGPQFGTLVVFNIVGFAVAEVPIVSFWLAPEATRARVDQLYLWTKAHQRPVVATLAALVGLFFVLRGLNDV
jgi:hypothetical protein